MAYKFEINGSALKITDTSASGDVLIPKNVIWYDDVRLDAGFVKLSGLDYAVDNNFQSSIFFNPLGVLLSDCIDKDDVIFTQETFKEFVSANLGFNGGGGNGSGVTLDDLFVVERDAEGNIIKTISIYYK